MTFFKEFRLRNPYQQLTSNITDPSRTRSLARVPLLSIPPKESPSPFPAYYRRSATTTLPDGSIASAAIEQLTYDTLGRRTLTTDPKTHDDRIISVPDFCSRGRRPRKRSVTTTDRYLKSVHRWRGSKSTRPQARINARGANYRS